MKFAHFSHVWNKPGMTSSERYHQLWRVLIYQLCYTNSTECLFAAMTVYNMRVVERVWGSRKFAVRFLSLTLFHLLSGAIPFVISSAGQFLS